MNHAGTCGFKTFNVLNLGGDDGVLACHRISHSIFVGTRHGIGTPILAASLTDRAANEPPRFLVFSEMRARRAGLLDTDPLARVMPYAELLRFAEGVVADETAVQVQVNDLGGGYVRDLAGCVRWVEATPRDRGTERSIAAEERRYADERLMRRIADDGGDL